MVNGIRRIVIWAHSECRSNAALYAAVRKRAAEQGVAVKICLWNQKLQPDYRKIEIEDAVVVGKDYAKGLAVLREFGGPDSVQVFCVYQNSSVWRRLIVEAKRGGARVVVNAEAPCEMCLGVKAVLKRLYYRFVLPWKLHTAIHAADLFINASGESGIDRLVRLGWKREKIVPFGYASPRLVASGQRLVISKEKKLSSIVNLNLQPQPSLRVLHLGGEAPYRGVKIAEEAAKIAGVELVKTGGMMSEEELVAEIRRADVVVGCGYCEPWGMRINDVLLEGVPVIVSDGMGAAAACNWYGCGCVVPKGNAAALAKVLKRCKDEPEFLAKLRSGAQVAAKELQPENRAEFWLEEVLGIREEGVGIGEELVAASFWEEHCTECGEPECYRSCVKYVKGRGGRCRRFAGGLKETILNNGVEARFLPWGKMEAYFHGGMITRSRAVKLERLMERTAWLRRLFPKWWRSWRWRWTFRGAQPGCPKVWRCVATSERDEQIVFEAIDRVSRVDLFRSVVELKAGMRKVVELRLPPTKDGTLFRIFTQDGEGTGRIRFECNELTDSAREDTSSTVVKCVAWDLDGVIWDGTLSEGEDVKLHPDVMETIKALDEVGVVSSICSKNDEDVAIAKLKELGIEEWFVFPQINWGPKSEGLKNLAKEMNIGLDAIVFIDDREENRAEVRTNCPEVQVLDEREWLVASGQWLVDSGEKGLGSKRRLMYREEMRRRGSLRTEFAGDTSAFLAASGLQFELLSVEGERIDRCRELVQRTNQLNLTARRYDEKAFGTLLAESECKAVRVWDRYGDYGIVGFVAMKGSHIVELCFSCRVAEKGIEKRVLEKIAAGRKLTADIVETARNGKIREIVREFLTGKVEVGG